jgi:heme-degrading monooxygenase HmoA
MGDTGFCTVLDHSVDGQHTQRTLIDALADVHERWLCHHPGYRLGQFLASLDSRRVLSVVQWDTEAAFAAFETSSDHAAVMADIQQALNRLPGLTDTRIDRFHALRHVQLVRS